MYSIAFGGTGDVPVPGVYYPTATSQEASVAVFRPSTGQYFVRTPGGGTQVYQFAPGDIPAPGDYYGTGATDPAVFRPSTGQLLVVKPGTTTPVVFATFATNANDVPVTAPYPYRALNANSTTISKASATTITAQSIDLGSTARTFSTASTSATTSTSTTTTTTTRIAEAKAKADAKAAADAAATRVRQAAAKPAAGVLASLSRLLKRKNRHPSA